MGKDPAFLFYSSDFLTGITFMSNEQVGMYVKLLCLQHQNGKLTKDEMNHICSGENKLVFSKFKKRNGYYYNQRLADETEKRKRYSESRRRNRLGSISKPKKHVLNTSTTHDLHVENENRNENKDVIIKHKHGKFKNVLLTEKEMERLIKDHGQDKTDLAIEFFSAYIKEKAPKSKDHNLTLRRWVFKAVDEQSAKTKYTGEIK